MTFTRPESQAETVAAKPEADIPCDVAVVRALLDEQHPDLAPLPLIEVGEGWDNRVFRLGASLAVRLPRRKASAALIEQEQRWLPGLAARLPVPIPAPVRVGRPTEAFPWPWSVVPWFEGESALVQPPHDPESTEEALTSFVRALHRPAPADAPHNAWRAVPLSQRDALVHTHLDVLKQVVDLAAVRAIWQRAVSAPQWAGPRMWIHGDLFPGNLVVNAGRIAAVIDFGDLTAGDPATDLAIAWMLLPSALRGGMLASASTDHGDPHLPLRARGWALVFGLLYLANSAGDAAMRRLGQQTIDAVLEG